MTALTTSTPTPGAPAGQRLRLALSLRGGVSLAVWIGGAVRELDLARRSVGAPFGGGGIHRHRRGVPPATRRLGGLPRHRRRRHGRRQRRRAQRGWCWARRWPPAGRSTRSARSGWTRPTWPSWCGTSGSRRRCPCSTGRSSTAPSSPRCKGSSSTTRRPSTASRFDLLLSATLLRPVELLDNEDPRSPVVETRSDALLHVRHDPNRPDQCDLTPFSVAPTAPGGGRPIHRIVPAGLRAVAHPTGRVQRHRRSRSRARWPACCGCCSRGPSRSCSTTAAWSTTCRSARRYGPSDKPRPTVPPNDGCSYLHPSPGVTTAESMQNQQRKWRRLLGYRRRRLPSRRRALGDPHDAGQVARRRPASPRRIQRTGRPSAPPPITAARAAGQCARKDRSPRSTAGPTPSPTASSCSTWWPTPTATSTRPRAGRREPSGSCEPRRPPAQRFADALDGVAPLDWFTPEQQATFSHGGQPGGARGGPGAGARRRGGARPVAVARAR